MKCPICQKIVPFGLPIHMLAAHGSNNSVYDRESARLKTGAAPKNKKWTRRGGKKSTKKVSSRSKHF